MTRVPSTEGPRTEYRIRDLVEPTADGRGVIFAFREGIYPLAPDGEQPPSDFWLNVREDDGRDEDGYDLYVDERTARKLVAALLVRLGADAGEYRENSVGGFTWDSDRVSMAAELLAPLLDLEGVRTLGATGVVVEEAF